jgi:hypothetical protein
MADPGAADAAEGATAANKDLWTSINVEYTDEQALRSWAAEDISWGVFDVPEAELDVLGDVAGLDVVDLGCGTVYLSAVPQWTARPPRPAAAVPAQPRRHPSPGRWPSAGLTARPAPNGRSACPGPVRPRRFAGIPAGWMMT